MREINPKTETAKKVNLQPNACPIKVPRVHLLQGNSKPCKHDCNCLASYLLEQGWWQW